MKTYIVTTKSICDQEISLGKTAYLELQNRPSLIGLFNAKEKKEAYFQACDLLINRSFCAIQMHELPDMNIYEVKI